MRNGTEDFKNTRFEVISIFKLTYECFLLADFEGIAFGLKLLLPFFEADSIFPLRKQIMSIDCLRLTLPSIQY